MNNKSNTIRKKIGTIFLLSIVKLLFAQTNTFPTTGNVGVGTLSPGAKQEIYLSAGGDNLLRLNTGFTGGNRIDINPFVSGSSNGGFEIKQNDVQRIVIGTTGNIGIGTTLPISDLEVANTNGGKLTISTKKASGTSVSPLYPSIDFAGYLNGLKARITATEETYNGHGSKFSIWVNDGSGASNLVERLRILQNGNIGIGPTSPTHRLTSTVSSMQPGGDQSYPFFASVAGKGVVIGYDSVNDIGLINGVDTGVLWKGISLATYAGNVGIGTANPQAKLDVSGNASFSNELKIQNLIRIGYNAPSYGISIASQPSNWGRGYYFSTTDGVSTLGGYAAYGPANDVEFFYIGNHHSNSIVKFYKVDKKVIFEGNTMVNAKLEAKEVKVTTTPTADFVFAENYDLPKLEEVEKHIREKKHLPEIASAKEMEKDGVNVGEFQIKLLQKIEELTLYTIEQNKEIKKLQQEILQIKNKK